MITEGFPYGTREQSFIQTEYEELKKKYDVTILSRSFDSQVKQEGYENEKVIRFSDRVSYRLLPKTIFNKDTIKELKKAFDKEKPIKQQLKLFKEILRYANLALSGKSLIHEIIDKEDISIVYTYWCTQETLSCIWIKKEKPSLIAISRFHGADLYNERSQNNWQPFRSLMAKELDLLVFVSEAGKRYFEEKWGRKGIVNYLGTRIKRQIAENESEYVIVSCSNLIPLKRVEIIIAALAAVKREIQVKWYHFGDGVCRKELEELADSLLGNKPNIEYHFRGFIRNDLLANEYCHIKPWLFITTSSTEGGSPVSIQEALSMGIPCVGTDVGGIPEAIYDGYNGFLLKANPEASDLTAVIERFYYMPKIERSEYRAHSYEVWEQKYDADNNAKAFVEEIDSLLL